MSVDRVRLAETLAWAEARYRSCDVCALACGIDRLAGERGFCGLGAEGRVYKEYLHLGEERSLVPSHTVYLAGCSMRCAFCSDIGPVKAPEAHGAVVSPEALAARIAQRRREGARNVNFVGGTPDTSLLFILRTLWRCPEDTHVVWNTNLWTTAEAVEQLRGIVGTWLADHKFGNDRCATRLSGTTGYGARVEARLLQVAASGAPLIVRHLLMPGHLDCCTRPVLAWLERQIPEASVNVMTGYHPYRLAGRGGKMGGGLEREERAAALEALAGTALRSRLVDGVEYQPPA
ncbi:MAG: radical SAM protein [Deltaproteobacteria bacterium]|nr:radical SAM protein [Deltaproteobacteria bacterium]